MNEWKTLKSETLDVGGNNFIEINLKKSPEGNELLAITKGWYTENKDKRYKTNILMSMDKVDELVDKIGKVCG
jgi:hypothetical protein